MGKGFCDSNLFGKDKDIYEIFQFTDIIAVSRKIA